MSKVQVYIQANDNLWYRQAEPKITGGTWEIDNCHFGNEDSDGMFEIVALDGSTRLDRTVTRLPKGFAQSSPVRVYRLPKPVSIAAQSVEESPRRERVG
jgi:hypothetical protein